MARQHIDDSAVDLFLFGPAGKASRVAERAARRVAERARVLAPMRTGRLRASIRASDARRTGRAEATATVSADTEYATFVHEGTRAHFITPRTGRALRFTNNGQLVFSRSVRHPGSRANRFLINAMNGEVGRDPGL